jgi:hypothetical protein
MVVKFINKNSPYEEEVSLAMLINLIVNRRGSNRLA